jgi:hypothetical protein
MEKRYPKMEKRHPKMEKIGNLECRGFAVKISVSLGWL